MFLYRTLLTDVFKLLGYVSAELYCMFLYALHLYLE